MQPVEASLLAGRLGQDAVCNMRMSWQRDLQHAHTAARPPTWTLNSHPPLGAERQHRGHLGQVDHEGALRE